MKRLLFLCLALLVLLLFLIFHQFKTFVQPNKPETVVLSEKKEIATLRKLKDKASKSNAFLKQKGFSTHYVFLIDMSLPSGKARFFIYDLAKDAVVQAGLVAHGSCRTEGLAAPRFSNVPDCGCSSVGRYKIGGAYQGRFGKAFKLFGLDSSNSNAFKRAIVLHSYDCVPEAETAPYPICNSLGCPMVSPKFLQVATTIIEASKKPVLLWIYE